VKDPKDDPTSGYILFDPGHSQVKHMLREQFRF
jgi:hypothetical protein